MYKEAKLYFKKNHDKPLIGLLVLIHFSQYHATIASLNIFNYCVLCNVVRERGGGANFADKNKFLGILENVESANIKISVDLSLPWVPEAFHKRFPVSVKS